jgi:isocitrate dehydrogenase (NAD+)
VLKALRRNVAEGAEMRKIVCIPGDGIGPEVTGAMKRVVSALGVDIEWIDMPAGESAITEYGKPLPKITLDAVRLHKLAIKGPTTTPGGGGYKSVNMQLRQELDLYAGFRPVKSLLIPGTTQGVNLVFFRENNEGLYACAEEVVGTPPSSRKVTLTAHFTEDAMRRLATRAFLFA